MQSSTESDESAQDNCLLNISHTQRIPSRTPRSPPNLGSFHSVAEAADDDQSYQRSISNISSNASESNDSRSDVREFASPSESPSANNFATPQSLAFGSQAGQSALSSLFGDTRLPSQDFKAGMIIEERQTNKRAKSVCDKKRRGPHTLSQSHQHSIGSQSSHSSKTNRHIVGEMTDVERENLAAMSDTQRFRIIKSNLNDPDAVDDDMVRNHYPISSYTSTAHGLLGGTLAISTNLEKGDVTHNIYQWTDKTLPSAEKRRASDTDINGSLAESAADGMRASDLRAPGMFRRNFIANRAIEEGRKSQPFLTKNFIDFLVLYGSFGGDVHPSDDEDSDADFCVDDIERRGQRAEREPLMSRRGSAPSANLQGTSSKKAFFMIIKAFVGTGVLFLPKAFSLGGMGFSIIILVLMGYLTLHCMLLLVETSKVVGGSFGEIGEKLFGPRVRGLVLTSITVAQMGFSCAYYIFVAQNLRDLVMIISDCTVILPEWFCICIQFAFYIPLSWIRKIKHFSFTALIADAFILLGLSYIFYYDLVTLSIYGAKEIVWFNFEGVPLFFGTALFSFEGICLILPIADSMKEPEKFNGVLTRCMMVIASLFLVIGATGYLTFGNDVATVVFLNLPMGAPVVTLLQVFYVVAIMLSFPLCVYPAIRITEEAIFKLRHTGKKSLIVKWVKNTYRAVLVVLLALVAYLGSHNLDKVVSLVGCFACIPLSFIYPALFHYKISNNLWVRVKDGLIVVFGVLAMLYTTAVTLRQFIVGSPDIPMNRCLPH